MDELRIVPVYVERKSGDDELAGDITSIVEDSVNLTGGDGENEVWFFESHGRCLAFRLSEEIDGIERVSFVVKVEGEPKNENDGDCLVRKKFEDRTYWVEEWDKTRPVSYSAAGVMRVFALKENGEFIAKTPLIRIRPKCVEPEEYEQMVRELIFYDKALAGCAEATVGVLLKNELHDSDYLRLVDDLVNEMRAIRNRPGAVLKKFSVNIPARKIHRYDSRVVKSIVQRGEAGKVCTMVAQESHDIYENQVIKSYVTWLRDNLGKRIEERGDDVIAEEMRRIYKAALSIVEQELRNSWYEPIADRPYEWPRPTQLFLRNPHYSRIYQIMTELEEEDELERAWSTGAFFRIGKTCDVYECWVLFRIVRQLLNSGFELVTEDMQALRSDVRNRLLWDLRGSVQTKLGESEGERSKESLKHYAVTLKKKLVPVQKGDSSSKQKTILTLEIKVHYTEKLYYRHKQKPLQPKCGDLYCSIAIVSRTLQG